jgi:putative resolvase
MLGGAPGKRLTVVYCRVSRAGQREDLVAQVGAMEQYCRAGDIAVDEWIQEVGGGTNFRRKCFLTLIERIHRGEIERVLIAHKDRLVRFGFDLLDDLSREHGCEIAVVNQESLSPGQEMVEDLLAIVHTFSRRLYGMRKYRKQIREDFPGSREKKDILQ